MNSSSSPVGRTFVRVQADFETTGDVIPRAVVWEDGRQFYISRILTVFPASHVYSSCSGMCFSVLFQGDPHARRLFCEPPRPPSNIRPARWWVETRAGQ